MAITTLKGHVSRALDFYNKDDIYIGIGRTQPWEDDYNPPDPANTDEMEDAVGYKKVESIFLVKPDPTGELRYRNSRWKIVPYEDALNEGARWIYLSTFITYGELPTNVSYRQIAAYTGLERVEGLPEGQYTLTPEQVKDEGIIEILDNRTPIFREPDQREQLVLVIEF